MYKGLDIITAKATKEEQNRVPHHLISVLDPHETMTVLEYRNRALKIVSFVTGSNKVSSQCYNCVFYLTKTRLMVYTI